MNGGDLAMDPGIKLFGRTIPLPDSLFPANSDGGGTSETPNQFQHMEVNSEVADVDQSASRGDKSLTPEIEGDCQILPQVKKTNQQNLAPPKEEVETQSQSETHSGGDQDKVLKKPDKVLPCPRCHSNDTKFCYFNNYNVNQPRHFCKNCQRYWTAGGTTRNVPVGAGRRKNKQLASQYHQIILSADALPAFGATDPSSSFASNSVSGTVLKFVPEGPLGQSYGLSQKSFAEAAPQTSSFNAKQFGFKESSFGSSSLLPTTFRGNEMHENLAQKGMKAGPMDSGTGPTSQQAMPCYPVPPWALPMNPSWNGVAPAGVTAAAPNYNPSNSMQWCSPQMLAVPGFCAPSIPLQLVPAPSYWGCMPMWPPGMGNVPMAATDPASNNSCLSGNGSSLTLGKHSRDPNVVVGGRGERVVENKFPGPKMVRTDGGGGADHEASWSSIWSALAMNLNQHKDVAGGGGVGTKNSVFTSEVLQANPAALSRSLTFQENLR